MVEIEMKKKNKRPTIAKNLLKLTIVAALTPLIYVGGELVFGRYWDKQSLLNEHDDIDYIQTVLKNDVRKHFMSAEERREWNQKLERLVESHISYQKKPFQGKLYEFFPYTPKCPWCEQLRSENQR